MSFDFHNFVIALWIVIFLIGVCVIAYGGKIPLVKLRRLMMDAKTRKFLVDNPSLDQKTKDFLTSNPRESNTHEERLKELQMKPYLTQGESMEVEFLLKRKYDLTKSSWGV